MLNFEHHYFSFTFMDMIVYFSLVLASSSLCYEQCIFFLGFEMC